METLAKRLTETRDALGLTQGQLAKKAGLKNQSIIGMLESGQRKNSAHIPVIADALGVSALWLATGKGSKEQDPPAPLDILAIPMFPLHCPECGKTSHKAFIELEMNDRLPCGVCGITFNINDQYGTGQLEMFLKGIGRAGFSLRKDRKFD